MIYLGDCLHILKKFPDNSIDSIITDPPYGLSFMGKKWDYDVPSIEIWKEALRVLKPGGHLLSFGGTRTYHRLVVNIEDAGFEIRDCIQWNFGSGFPKSTSVKKSGIKQGIFCGCENTNNLSSVPDSKNGLEVLDQENKDADLLASMQRKNSGIGSGKIQQQWLGEKETGQGTEDGNESSLEGRDYLQTEQRELHRPEVCQVSEGILTDEQEGRLYNGTSIDCSSEDKPFVITDRGCSSSGPQYSKQSNTKFGVMADKQKSQASRTWDRCPLCSKPICPDEGLGTALKPANEPICVARKPLEKVLTVAENVQKYGTGALNIDASRIATEDKIASVTNQNIKGAAFKSDNSEKERDTVYTQSPQGRWPANIILDEEAAAVLDEQAASQKLGRSAGGGDTEAKNNETNMFGKNAKAVMGVNNYSDTGGASRFFYVAKSSKRERGEGNIHPTVKPIKLMEYLIKLVTPPNGTTLDPFMGSGTTGVAAKNLGFDFIGCEMSEDYFKIAQNRINPTPSAEKD